MDSFTGLAGVGCFIAPDRPVCDWQDFTLRYASSAQLLCITGSRNGRLGPHLHLCSVYLCLPGTLPIFFQPYPVTSRTTPTILFWRYSVRFFPFNSIRPVRTIGISTKSGTSCLIKWQRYGWSNPGDFSVWMFVNLPAQPVLLKLTMFCQLSALLFYVTWYFPWFKGSVWCRRPH